VRVFEYEARFIHAKTMVCDRDIAMIGSANLDNRSFRLNFEVAAVVFGETVNGTLADAFIADLRASRELTPVEFQGEAFVARLGQAAARLISPLL
jgi:cardiolipin synthase